MLPIKGDDAQDRSALSHHADSYLARQYPQLDICDVFLFRGTAGTVFIQTLNPLSGPAGFHSGGQYGFHLDLNGDARPEITFRVSFRPQHDGMQPVEVRRLEGRQAGDRDADGPIVASTITDTLIETPAGLRLWAGPAADPSWINGGVLTAAQQCIRDGMPFDVGMARTIPAMNLLAYSDVTAIVLEIPDRVLGDSPVGLWATTAMPSPAGWVQVNRCAMPLLNTLFAIDDEEAGLNFNGTWPHQDRALYSDVVRAGAARAARALGTATDPAAHGTWVAEILLPDILPYQPGTKAHFGRGVRNGRALRDPAAEVMMSLVLGMRVPFGLDASSAPGPLRATFPYLSAPVAPV
jgi:hypothetical protein